jgi:hypothetical protein
VADVYGLMVTKAGAAVVSKSKTNNIATSCSTDGERVATVKVTEIVSYFRQAAVFMGCGIWAPTLVSTDNSANGRICSGEGSASRLRHMLRRYILVQQAVKAAEVYVRHVTDEENPADFLTKWLAAKKFEMSIEYATNSKRAVEETPAAFKKEAEEKLAAALAKAARG